MGMPRKWSKPVVLNTSWVQCHEVQTCSSMHPLDAKPNGEHSSNWVTIGRSSQGSGARDYVLRDLLRALEHVPMFICTESSCSDVV